MRAGASTKRVWTEPNPDGTHRIERAENVKDVAQYIARIDEMIQRKQKLLQKNKRVIYPEIVHQKSIQ